MANPQKKKMMKLIRKKKKDKKIFTELQELLKKVEEFNKINIEKSKVKSEYIEQMENCENKIKRNQSKLIKVKKDVKVQIKEFCDIFNIPYIHKETEEADPICSYLVRNKIADVCLTNDYDLIGYQCPIIIKDLEYLSDSIKVIDINKISEDLKFYDLNKLSFFLILFGNDYIKINRKINLLDVYKNLVKYSIKEVLEIYKEILDKEKINNVLYNVYLKNINIENLFSLSELNNQNNKFININKYDNYIQKNKVNTTLVKNIQTYYMSNKYNMFKNDF